MDRATEAALQRSQLALIQDFPVMWGYQRQIGVVLVSAIQQGYSGNLIRFATSLANTYFEKISPRPVWIFHAPKDPIITFDNGKRFFQHAKVPVTFIELGDHGMTDVDDRIIVQWAQIYATRE